MIRGKLPAGRKTFGYLVIIVLFLILFSVGTTAAQNNLAGGTQVAYDMVGAGSQNLNSFIVTTAGGTDPVNWGPGDWFGVSNNNPWPQPAGMPFALADDSVADISGGGINPGDTLGIIDSTIDPNDRFLGGVDLTNGDNPSGVVTATWKFDISGYTNLSLSLDMAAMGDFESGGDIMDWSYQVDGGAEQAAFTSSIDEAGSQTYTMEDGDMVSYDDPMLINGIPLDDTFQTFTETIASNGITLTVTLDAVSDGGSEAFAARNLIIMGDPTGVFLNEIQVSTDSTDWEFFEIFGAPSTDLSALTLIGIESDNQTSAGTIDKVISLSGQAIPADGFWLGISPAGETEYGVTGDLGIDNNSFENSSATYLLVENFSGSAGDDLDTDNDGVLDVMPWTSIVDGLAIIDADVGDFAYTTPIIGPDGSFLPSGTYRCPDAPAGNFSNDNFHDFSNADGSPGVSNAVQCTDVPPQITATTPADGANSVPTATNVILEFSENVDLTASAATIECPVGNPITFTGLPANDVNIVVLDPDADLPAGTTCTVTAVATEITDLDGAPDELDGDGDGTGGDDYTFSFTTTTGDVCQDPATPIHDIQGSGSSSPEVGNIHTIQGVVVGDFQTDSNLRGFYVQEENGEVDGDPATSEGIFVFDGNIPAVDVNIKDEVRVTGTVAEYFDLTELTSVTSVVICSDDNTVAVTPLPLPETVDGELEQYEGMLVRVFTPMTVVQNYFLGRYGQLTLSASGRLYQPTNQELPGSPAAMNVADQNARSLLFLDDGQDISDCGDNPAPVPYLFTAAVKGVRAGDMVSNLIGVLDYGKINSGAPCSNASSFARDYRLQPVKQPVFQRKNPRRPAPDPIGGSLRVASFNVLNYFNGDGMGGGFPTSRGADTLTEFKRQHFKIVKAILAMDADIIGLIEIENDGFGAFSAIQTLVDGLNLKAGAGTYAFIDPGIGPIGTDEITVGFIYKPGEVTPVNNAAVLLDTGFTDPRGYGSQYNRPAIAQTFEEIQTGEEITVVVNHLKSKGSSCGTGDDDLTTGQGNCNGTRTDAAVYLTSWLLTDPTASGDPDFLVIGDLNSYAQEDPITALAANGYTNLILALNGPLAYSYIFDGQSGYLDHGLANAALLPQVVGITEWHINADEATVLDYDLDFNPPGLYRPNPFRSSDHDPVIVGLNLLPD